MKDGTTRPSEHYLIHSFSRRLGRALSPKAKRLMEQLLPTIDITLPSDGPLDLAAIFPDKRAIHLEIGFGGGEHLAAQAAHQPDIGFIGCEPYLNGVAKLLAHVEREGLNNIRLFTDDARLLVEKMPPESIRHIDILFPDPWPKERHHKRRLISAQTLALLAKIQPAGATLLIATDHVEYGSWILEVLLASEHYEWTATKPQDWQQPPESWVETRYQQKTSEQGRAPLFVKAQRI